MGKSSKIYIGKKYKNIRSQTHTHLMQCLSGRNLCNNTIVNHISQHISTQSYIKLKIKGYKIITHTFSEYRLIPKTLEEYKHFCWVPDYSNIA